MVGPRNYPINTLGTELLVGDASRNILPAPGSDKLYIVLTIGYIVLTSAAQAITIAGPTTGTLFKLAASVPVGTSEIINFGDGKKMTLNEVLTVTPAAAGPGIWFIVNYELVAV